MGMGMGMDPAIKLFGSTIPLPDYEFPAAPAGVSAATAVKKMEMGEAAADPSVKMVEESPEAENGGGRLRIATPVGGDLQGGANPGDRVETGGGGPEKVGKRPDKVLPCPRCHSRDTKFCYFNNYNVNQPRHFCKNCQRYWTAGGATRNVPVGAGRRKNKQFASHYHQIILSADALPAFARDVSSASASSFQPSSGHSGTVLRFGPEQPLRHQSIAHPKAHPEPPPLDSFFGTKSADSSSYGTPEYQKIGAPCHPLPPWVVPVNPGWTGGVAPSTVGPSCGNPNAVQWCPTPVVSMAGFCAPSIPLQLVAAPSYWGCMPLWPATGIGSFAVAAGPNSLAPTADTAEGGGCVSGGKSPSFSMQFGEEASEPRETRADGDGDQGARWSSFWSAMAVNVSREKEGGDTKGQEILQANPAAVPPSRTLHDRT